MFISENSGVYAVAITHRRHRVRPFKGPYGKAPKTIFQFD